MRRPSRTSRRHLPVPLATRPAGVRLLAAIVLAACGTEESSRDMPTSDWRPDFRIVSSAAGTDVTARLLLGPSRTVRLEAGDIFRARIDTTTNALHYVHDALLGHVYEQDFPPARDGSAVLIELDRAGIATDAPSSTGTMPVRPAASSPEAGTTVPVGSTVTLDWTPSGTTDALSLGLAVTTCSNGAHGGGTTVSVTADPGSAQVVLDATLLPASLPSGGTCQYQLYVDRTRAGIPDPAFRTGGQIRVTQRSNPVTITGVKP